MLNENVVLVTGGAGLIGSAISREIINNGGKVIIGDKSNDKGIAVQDELGIEDSIYIELDVSDKTSIDNLIRKGNEHFGNIDSVVHCAYPRSEQWGTRFEDLEPDGLKEDIFQQLGGAIILSQRIIAFFREQGHGNLIHVSSIQGVFAPKFEHYKGTSMVSPIEYSAIKAGIISITRYLAKYCKGQNIRVNCVSPGGVLDGQPEAFLEKYNNDCINKGMLDADDITGLVIFLLSNESKYISGQNIIIDDGWNL